MSETRFHPDFPLQTRLREALGERGFTLRVVEGDSMLPHIRPGDTVLVKPLTLCRPGRVVVVDRGVRLVTHRIIRVKANGIVCRGDNTVRADPLVSRDRVIGEVVEVVGRGPIPHERWRAHVALGQLIARRAVRLTVRAAHELDLLVRQLRGRAMSSMVAETGFQAPVYGASPIVAASLEAPDSMPGTDRKCLIVPAGLYSRLPPLQRREVLARLAGRQVEVWAYGSRTAGRVVRVTASLRRALRYFGLSAGDPGDAWLAPLNGLGAGFIHYFTSDELRSELERAGGGQVTVTVQPPSGLLKASALL